MKKWWLDKRLGLLIFAILLGGIAAWGTKNYIQQQVDSYEEKNREERMTVVVAAHPLEAGVVLNEQSLATREVPVTWVPTGAVLPHDFAVIAHSKVNQTLQSGEIILWSHIQKPETQTFSQRLQEGKRALAVAVDDLHAVAGLMQPGDYIDLYVSFEYAGRSVTARLLENVLILATGQRQNAHTIQIEDEIHSYSSLTLELTTEQAEQLLVARETARLIPVLKSPEDKSVADQRKLEPLAKTLGVQLKIPPAKKRVPVIYGDQSIGKIPALSAIDTSNTETPSSLEKE